MTAGRSSLLLPIVQGCFGISSGAGDFTATGAADFTATGAAGYTQQLDSLPAVAKFLEDPACPLLLVGYDPAVPSLRPSKLSLTYSTLMLALTCRPALTP